jgi:hypothetical protein
MSFITGVLNSLTGGLIGDIGNTVKKFVTTDEDRLKFQVELEQLFQNFTLKLNDQIIALESQVTERQKNDMASDSWLSKNVRPIVLVYLVIVTTLLAYLTIFFLEPDKVALLTPWISVLNGLLITAFTFYFGGRTIEKVQQMKNGTNK